MHGSSFCRLPVGSRCIFVVGEHAKTREHTALRYEGLSLSSRAAQQGCGGSERGISSGQTNVFTVIQPTEQEDRLPDRITKLTRSLIKFFLNFSECLCFPLMPVKRLKQSDTTDSRSLAEHVSKEEERINFFSPFSFTALPAQLKSMSFNYIMRSIVGRHRGWVMCARNADRIHILSGVGRTNSHVNSLTHFSFKFLSDKPRNTGVVPQENFYTSNRFQVAELPLLVSAPERID